MGARAGDARAARRRRRARAQQQHPPPPPEAPGAGGAGAGAGASAGAGAAPVVAEVRTLDVGTAPAAVRHAVWGSGGHGNGNGNDDACARVDVAIGGRGGARAARLLRAACAECHAEATRRESTDDSG